MTAPIARIEPLQVLRGIAAMIILAKHALYEVGQISPLSFHYGNTSAYLVGIDIFFVLSGFIMVYISREQSGVQAAKNFVVRRLLRIVPTYWFYTFLLLVVALTMPQVLDTAEFVPLDFLKSLFFIPYMNTAGYVQPFLASGWTLNYEIYFYLVFAACLILPAKYGLAAMGAYFVLSVLSGFGGADGEIAKFYGDKIVLEFLAGSVIGWLFLKDIRLPPAFFYVGCVFCVLSIAALFFTAQMASVGVSYSGTLVGVMLVFLLALPRGSELISMPRWSVYIGDASYTIYLSHPFAIGAVTQVFVLLGWQGVINPWVIFLITFFVSIIGGCIAYKIIEKPLLSFTKSLVYKDSRKI